MHYLPDFVAHAHQPIIIACNTSRVARRVSRVAHRCFLIHCDNLPIFGHSMLASLLLYYLQHSCIHVFTDLDFKFRVIIITCMFFLKILLYFVCIFLVSYTRFFFSFVTLYCLPIHHPPHDTLAPLGKLKYSRWQLYENPYYYHDFLLGMAVWAGMAVMWNDKTNAGDNADGFSTSGCDCGHCCCWRGGMELHWVGPATGGRSL